MIRMFTHTCYNYLVNSPNLSTCSRVAKCHRNGKYICANFWRSGVKYWRVTYTLLTLCKDFLLLTFIEDTNESQVGDWVNTWRIQKADRHHVAPWSPGPRTSQLSPRSGNAKVDTSTKSWCYCRQRHQIRQMDRRSLTKTICSNATLQYPKGTNISPKYLSNNSPISLQNYLLPQKQPCNMSAS